MPGPGYCAAPARRAHAGHGQAQQVQSAALAEEHEERWVKEGGQHQHCEVWPGGLVKEVLALVLREHRKEVVLEQHDGVPAEGGVDQREYLPEHHHGGVRCIRVGFCEEHVEPDVNEHEHQAERAVEVDALRQTHVFDEIREGVEARNSSHDVEEARAQHVAKACASVGVGSKYGPHGAEHEQDQEHQGEVEDSVGDPVRHARRPTRTVISKQELLMQIKEGGKRIRIFNIMKIRGELLSYRSSEWNYVIYDSSSFFYA